MAFSTVDLRQRHLGYSAHTRQEVPTHLDRPVRHRTDEWLWGWDPTPGIVSVHATADGRALVWRRLTETDTLVCEEERFRPWLLLEHIEDLRHLGPRLGRDDDPTARFRHRELDGPGALRHLVSADDGRALVAAVLRGASDRLGRRITHLGELGRESVLALPPEEQYLVATGRTYFRGLPFDRLHRLQFDLETTGLDPRRDRIFMISVRYPTGDTEVLEAANDSDEAEAELIRRLVARVRAADPDVIENHNLHGFDLPFLDHRARALGVRLALGRIDTPGLRQRAAWRGVPARLFGDPGDRRRVRLVAPGRELIDTLDAVHRHDFATRELPSHGLKAVARHLGLAAPDREYIPGDRIYATYRTDPERVRRYATDDVEEVAAISRVLGGAAYALAQMVPRRYERLADAGAATGVLDPLLVRAYLRAGMALPAHEAGDGTPHSGAALYLFATGVAHRVVKADVASLYPSLMRTYRIGPSRDRLGALLALVDALVEQRLDAKARARAAPPGSAERHTHEAMSAALKIVVNSAYGYLAAGGLTRFADVHAANEVTRRGREVLALICRALAERGVTLLEGDTDGVYFAVPPTWTEEDERRAVAEVAAQLPPLVQLELEGRYAAMLSHEPKNYALLGYDGTLRLRGVAFRSSRAEPFGEAFLRRAIARLLAGDVPGVREAYLATLAALRARDLSTYAVSSRVRLTKSPRAYLAARAKRRELPYEALLASGRTTWRVGDRVRVYRKQNGEAGLIGSTTAPSDDDAATSDPRDYDVDYYARLLRATYAQRLARAFAPADFAVVFADADQLALFATPLDTIRPVLTSVDRLDE
ncbi:MAG: ribonuclease H-like domain-containing protein [Gemmatimonadaceae bacterium]|nr:ribonuclease H-like domain-containing protein [Gemmatimonadaceae bacterium]